MTTQPPAAPGGSAGGGPIFHLALEADWHAARSAGEYRISTLGRTFDDEGFIHASYARQVAGVLGRFYGGVTGTVLLLELDAASLPVTVEPAVPGAAPGSAGAEEFPHIYGPIPVTAVTRVTPLDRDASGALVAPDAV